MKNAIAIVVTLIGLYAAIEYRNYHENAFEAAGDAVYLMDVVNEISAIKIRIAEHYARTAEYPKNNADLGIDQPTSFANKRIRSLTVSSEGEIIAALTEKNDVLPTIRMVPDHSLSNSGIVRWKCLTENIAETTLEYIPNCSNYDAPDIKITQNDLPHKVKNNSDEPLETTTPNEPWQSHKLVVAIANGNDSVIENLLPGYVADRPGPVFAAVKANRFDLLYGFIEAGASVNSVDAQGNSLLMAAVLSTEPYTVDDQRIIRLLLNSGANARYVSKRNLTALSMVRMPVLPDDNKPENEKSKKERRIYSAYEKDSITIARLLINHGALVNVSDDSDATPISKAVWAGSSEMVKLYLENGAAADSYGPHSRHLLDIAIKEDYGNIAMQLLERGASFGKTTGKQSREKLLILAIQQNVLPIANQLLDSGLDADQYVRIGGLINNGITAALASQRWDIALKIIRDGVELPTNIKLYDLASRERWPDATSGDTTWMPTIEYLLETTNKNTLEGFLPFLANPDHNALHFALSNGYPYLVKPLLKAGANPDSLDNRYGNLLEVSILNNYESIALILLEAQAIPKSKNELQALWQLAYDHDLKKIMAKLSEKLQIQFSPTRNLDKTPSVQSEMASDNQGISLWQINCEEESDGWFGMISKANKESIILSGGTKTIPYPGFWTPVDVYNDTRFNWVNQFELQLKNFDKDAGWDGYKTFYNCEQKARPELIASSWHEKQDEGKVLSLYSDGTGHITDKDKVVGEILSSEDAFFGRILTVTECKRGNTVSLTFRINNTSKTGFMYHTSMKLPMEFQQTKKIVHRPNNASSVNTRKHCP